MPSAVEPVTQPAHDDLKRPSIVTIASWLWIGLGGLRVLYAVVSVLLLASGAFPEDKPHSVIRALEMIPILGAIFLYAGIQTLRGLLPRIGVFCVCSMLWGSLTFSEDHGLFAIPPPRPLGVVLLFSVWPVIAGALALAGHRRYIAWREAQKTSPAARNEE
jgi:hypothetical protein